MSATVLVASLVGCATTTKPAQPHQWSGRLALQVEDEPSQSFAALFELEGSDEQGQLTLFSPLGTVLGKLDWNEDSARLQAGNQSQQSESLDALLTQLTGAALPVAALFSWLEGIPANAPGWVSDLSALDQGRITAQRISPPPRATLRIALTR
jgi:outer membrane lipoprotein LolB